MKILIVDDNATRYEKLISGLTESCTKRESIDVAGSKQCALDKLESTQYDLLILDILIPIWPENSAVDQQHSIDLMNEIKLSDDLNRPRQIIGITANKELSPTAVSLFEEMTWQVVNYQEDSNEWINRIKNCATYISSEKKTSIANAIDILIICALKDPELSEILAIPWNWGAPEPIDDNTFVSYGSFTSGGKEYTACACHADRMGMVATTAISSKLIGLLKPKVVTMSGICAGVPGKTKCGDVIFAESVWDYQTGKHMRSNGGHTFQIAPHQLQADHQIMTHAKALSDEKKKFASIAIEYNGPIDLIPSLHVAPVATGSAVIADSDYMDSIINQNRKVLGLEMEIYGLYYSAETSSLKPKYFALKGVCDHGDQFKGDDYQKYAAYTSANMLKLFVETYGCRFI